MVAMSTIPIDFGQDSGSLFVMPNVTVTTSSNVTPAYDTWYNLGSVTNIQMIPPPTVNYQWVYPYTTGISNMIYQLTCMVNPYASISYGDNAVAPTEEQKRIWAEEEKKRIAAEAKAEELLLMCLSEKQRDQYCKHGYLEVNTDKAKYRINKGWSKNIEKLNAEGIPDLVYCIGSEILIPTADNMLAQKLMLECNESEFLRIANKWPTPGGIYVP